MITPEQVQQVPFVFQDSAVNIAVRGLARDRTALLEKRNSMNRDWFRYADEAAILNGEIAAIDERIDKLLAIAQTP